MALSGFGVGSALSFLLLQMVRVASTYFQSDSLHAHSLADDPGARSFAASSATTNHGRSDAPHQAVCEQGDSKSSVSVERLEEMAASLRRHMNESREATANLRRAMEAQQRQYQSSMADFQRKMEQALKKTVPQAPSRMEIAPQSLEALRSLISTDAHGSHAKVEDDPDTMKLWFAKFEANLQRFFLATSSKAESKRALQTLSLVVNNLVIHPTEEKYREVSTSSARFRETFGSPESGAAELLRLSGFERQEDAFVFPSANSLDIAGRAVELLQEALRDCDRRWEKVRTEGAPFPLTGSDVTANDNASSNAAPVDPACARGTVASAPAVGQKESATKPWGSTNASLGNYAGSTMLNGTGQACGSGNSGSSSASASTPYPQEVAPPGASFPWLSSASQKQMSRVSPALGRNGGSAGSAAIGPNAEDNTVVDPQRPATDDSTQAPVQVEAAHPAEAQPSSQAPHQIDAAHPAQSSSTVQPPLEAAHPAEAQPANQGHLQMEVAHPAEAQPTSQATHWASVAPGSQPAHPAEARDPIQEPQSGG